MRLSAVSKDRMLIRGGAGFGRSCRCMSGHVAYDRDGMGGSIEGRGGCGSGFSLSRFGVCCGFEMIDCLSDGYIYFSVWILWIGANTWYSPYLGAIGYFIRRPSSILRETLLTGDSALVYGPIVTFYHLLFLYND